jgi:glycine hydroxymethyltransferase
MVEVKDTDIEQLIEGERQREQAAIELIPSENYVSSDVRAALGSVFTNKYAEGYPGRRYYGGQQFTDQLESVAIERAKALFGSDHANVQPHSGAPANEAVYAAWCDPGDTILAMDLSHGGHLTHGAPVTHMAKLYNFVRYGMKDIETGEIDYEHLAVLAETHKPKIILAGFSAYPRELDYEKFAEIGQKSGALLVADMAHIAGLIAAKVLKNPLNAGFHVMTSTTHKTLRGPRGGLILSNGTVGNPLKAPERTLENIPTLIDRQVFPGLQGGPHMNTIAAKAVAFREASTPEFHAYAEQILKNAKVLADELMKRGFKLVTNGTDNHLMLIDMKRSCDIDGAEAEAALEAVGMTANKNAVPDDTLPPFRPSGLRLGTPAVTTRGLKEPDMATLAAWIEIAIKSRNDTNKLAELKKEVTAFAQQFPLPS